MEQPLVSIVIPTYNRPDRLGKAIQSVLDQSYPNIEIVVVNDCGTGAESVIEKLNTRKNIRYIRHSANKGLAGARNTGIHNAQGKYLGYLDDDDLFYPDHVATLVDYLETNQVDVAYTDSQEALQVQEGETFRTVKHFLRYSVDFDKELILVQNFVPVLCYLHNAHCKDVVGVFDESLRAHEDWDYWIRMSRHYSMHHIPKITSEYSQVINSSKDNMSRNLRRMHETAVQVHKKTFDLVKDRPDLLERQHTLAESIRLAWELQVRNEFNAFIEKLLKLFEETKTKEALAWYDESIDKFENALPDLDAELDKVNTIIRKFRGKNR